MNHTDLAAPAATRAAQTIERLERDLPNVRIALLADLDEIESLMETAIGPKNSPKMHSMHSPN